MPKGGARRPDGRGLGGKNRNSGLAKEPAVKDQDSLYFHIRESIFRKPLHEFPQDAVSTLNLLLMGSYRPQAGETHPIQYEEETDAPAGSFAWCVRVCARPFVGPPRASKMKAKQEAAWCAIRSIYNEAHGTNDQRTLADLQAERGGPVDNNDGLSEPASAKNALQELVVGNLRGLLTPAALRYTTEAVMDQQHWKSTVHVNLPGLFEGIFESAVLTRKKEAEQQSASKAWRHLSKLIASLPPGQVLLPPPEQPPQQQFAQPAAKPLPQDASDPNANAKNALQEFLQRALRKPLTPDVLNYSLQAFSSGFKCVVTVNHPPACIGAFEGAARRRKKDAEQDAARRALLHIASNPMAPRPRPAGHVHGTPAPAASQDAAEIANQNAIRAASEAPNDQGKEKATSFDKAPANPKGCLQEALAKQLRRPLTQGLLDYKTSAVRDSLHFQCVLTVTIPGVCEEKFTSDVHSKKKDAEQEAASRAWQKLVVEPHMAAEAKQAPAGTAQAVDAPASFLVPSPMGFR